MTKVQLHLCIHSGYVASDAVGIKKEAYKLDFLLFKIYSEPVYFGAD